MAVFGLSWRMWLAAWITVLVLDLMGADEENVLSGHWWQIPVLVLWAGAAHATVLRRPVLAGALVGVATGLEPWGILGLLVLALCDGLRTALNVAATAVIVASALWIPFVLGGSFQMAAYRWNVRADSIWSLIVGGESPFPWGLRVLQAMLIAVIGVLCVFIFIRPLRMAGQPQWLTACLLFPVVIVLLRVASDIWFGSYYLMSPAVLLVPTAVVWLLARRPAGIWFGLSSWVVLVAASGIQPFALSAVAFAAAVVGLRALKKFPAEEAPT